MQPLSQDIETGPLLIHVKHPVATLVGSYNGREIENLNQIIDQYRQGSKSDCDKMYRKFAVIFGIMGIISTALFIAGLVLISLTKDEYMQNGKRKNLVLSLLMTGAIGSGCFCPFAYISYMKCG